MRIGHITGYYDRITTPANLAVPRQPSPVLLSHISLSRTSQTTSKVQPFLSQLSEGTLIDGRYELKDRLGISFMSTVWTAIDTYTQRKVAIKFAIPEYINSLKNEGKILSKNFHPLIPELYGHGEVGGTYYIVMEFVEGETLKSLMKRPEKIPLWQAIEKTLMVLGVLAPLHRMGIVHRDIKPENIMKKIIDFGLACNIGHREKENAVGTPAYLSPEQATLDLITQRADIFSLGLILYEMVTRDNPFERDNAQQTVENHKKIIMPPLPQKAVTERFELDGNKELKENVETLHYQLRLIISMMAEHDPNQRIADVEEIAFHLERLHALAKELAPCEKLA